MIVSYKLNGEGGVTITLGHDEVVIFEDDDFKDDEGECSGDDFFFEFDTPIFLCGWGGDVMLGSGDMMMGGGVMVQCILIIIRKNDILNKTNCSPYNIKTQKSILRTTHHQSTPFPESKMRKTKIEIDSITFDKSGKTQKVPIEWVHHPASHFLINVLDMMKYVFGEYGTTSESDVLLNIVRDFLVHSNMGIHLRAEHLDDEYISKKVVCEGLLFMGLGTFNRLITSFFNYPHTPPLSDTHIQRLVEYEWCIDFVAEKIEDEIRAKSPKVTTIQEGALCDEDDDTEERDDNTTIIDCDDDNITCDDVGVVDCNDLPKKDIP